MPMLPVPELNKPMLLVPERPLPLPEFQPPAKWKSLIVADRPIPMLLLPCWQT